MHCIAQQGAASETPATGRSRTEDDTIDQSMDPITSGPLVAVAEDVEAALVCGALPVQTASGAAEALRLQQSGSNPV